MKTVLFLVMNLFLVSNLYASGSYNLTESENESFNLESTIETKSKSEILKKLNEKKKYFSENLIQSMGELGGKTFSFEQVFSILYIALSDPTQAKYPLKKIPSYIKNGLDDIGIDFSAISSSEVSYYFGLQLFKIVSSKAVDPEVLNKLFLEFLDQKLKGKVQIPSDQVLSERLKNVFLSELEEKENPFKSVFEEALLQKILSHLAGKQLSAQEIVLSLDKALKEFNHENDSDESFTIVNYFHTHIATFIYKAIFTKELEPYLVPVNLYSHCYLMSLMNSH